MYVFHAIICVHEIIAKAEMVLINHQNYSLTHFKIQHEQLIINYPKVSM